MDMRAEAISGSVLGMGEWEWAFSAKEGVGREWEVR